MHTPDHSPQPIIPGNEDIWRVWLTTHSSFSFQGQYGRLNALKEFRTRGTSYWYAYHTGSGQSKKRYLGIGAAMTLARLEKVAQDLQDIAEEQKGQLLHMSIPHVTSHTMQAGNEAAFATIEPNRTLNETSVKCNILVQIKKDRFSHLFHKPVQLVREKLCLAFLRSLYLEPRAFLTCDQLKIAKSMSISNLLVGSHI